MSNCESLQVQYHIRFGFVKIGFKSCQIYESGAFRVINIACLFARVKISANFRRTKPEVCTLFVRNK